MSREKENGLVHLSRPQAEPPGWAQKIRLRISHERRKTNAKIMALEGVRDLHLEARATSQRVSTCVLIMLWLVCVCV